MGCTLYEPAVEGHCRVRQGPAATAASAPVEVQLAKLYSEQHEGGREAYAGTCCARAKQGTKQQHRAHRWRRQRRGRGQMRACASPRTTAVHTGLSVAHTSWGVAADHMGGSSMAALQAHSGAASAGRALTISPVLRTMSGELAIRCCSVVLLLDVSPKSPKIPMRSVVTLPTAGSALKPISLDLCSQQRHAQRQQGQLATRLLAAPAQLTGAGP